MPVRQGKLTKSQFVAFLQRQADGSSFTRTLAARHPSGAKRRGWGGAAHDSDLMSSV